MSKKQLMGYIAEKDADSRRALAQGLFHESMQALRDREWAERELAKLNRETAVINAMLA